MDEMTKIAKQNCRRRVNFILENLPDDVVPIAFICTMPTGPALVPIDDRFAQLSLRAIHVMAEQLNFPNVTK